MIVRSRFGFHSKVARHFQCRVLIRTAMNIDRRQLNATPRRTATRAFTLIEILIVIALTAVLFALLLIPLISALRYTQQAQIVTAAQDAARITKERITRELSSAVFVFDGTSHPFVLASGTPQPGDDQFTNFLDLQIPSNNNPVSPVIAHAYNAKLDFVLPKLNDSGGTTDPTTGEPIAYTQSQNGSAIISNPSYVFPLAAGSTMIRYFVGLKDPTQPYNNSREGVSTNKPDNTYILYRAQFQPYTYNANPGPGKPAASANTNLFAERPKLDANGQPITDRYGNIIYIPELDDPDFFRYVSAADIDWLDDRHRTYGVVDPSGQNVIDHNSRVEKWVQISKAVIPGPNVDLILLPHNADNTLNYDAGTAPTPDANPCTATTCPAVAHSGIAHDPVTDNYYPIVNTSVTFRPATVSGNATPGTTADYNAQGSVSVDQSGFTYIPTVYTATSQSWSLPFHVSVFPGNYGTANASMYSYDTDQWASGSPAFMPAVSGVSINPGDVIEYRTDGASRAPVYDVTQGFPFTYNGTNYSVGGTQFVPMTINPDAGTITFSAPSLPNGPADRYTRKWTYAPAADPADPSISEVDLTGSGYTDLTLGTANPNPSPLTNATKADDTPSTALTGVENAHPVPGSVRVYGPDTVPGPNTGTLVPYTEVNLAVGGTIGEDQYVMDYAHNALDLQAGVTGAVQVIYDYQANMTLSQPLSSSPPRSLPVDLASNPYLPMQVTVDYQTRDLIDVNIGVRIYDITTNRAQVLPTETKIKIGNSNR